MRAPIDEQREWLRPSLLSKREESPADAAFRFALFCRSRLPVEDFSFLDASMREALARQQFQSQTGSYRAQYPDARFEIIEAEGQPVGRLVTHRDAQAFRIVDIALLPEWRRKGIGAHILREICDSARAEHVPVRLSLSLFNVDAFRLYCRLGFTAVAQDEIQILMEWRASQSRSGETGQDERDD